MREPFGPDRVAGLPRIGCDSRGNRARFDDLQQRGFNSVVNPQAMQRGLTLVEPAAGTTVARDVVLCAGVSDYQLSPATPAADKTGQQCKG